MVCDPINLNQLRPMCVKDGCLNRGKDCKLENGEILEEFCGVHFRTFVNQTKKKQKEIEKKTKKIEKMAVIKSIRVTRSKSKKK